MVWRPAPWGTRPLDRSFRARTLSPGLAGLRPQLRKPGCVEFPKAWLRRVGLPQACWVTCPALRVRGGHAPWPRLGAEDMSSLRPREWAHGEDVHWCGQTETMLPGHIWQRGACPVFVPGKGHMGWMSLVRAKRDHAPWPHLATWDMSSLWLPGRADGGCVHRSSVAVGGMSSLRAWEWAQGEYAHW